MFPYEQMFFTASAATQIAWLETHVAGAGLPIDADEKMWIRILAGLEPDISWEEYAYFSMEHGIKEVTQKFTMAQKEIEWLEKHVAGVRRTLTAAERKERDHKRNVERCKFYFPRGEE